MLQAYYTHKNTQKWTEQTQMTDWMSIIQNPVSWQTKVVDLNNFIIAPSLFSKDKYEQKKSSPDLYSALPEPPCWGLVWITPWLLLRVKVNGECSAAVGTQQRGQEKGCSTAWEVALRCRGGRFTRKLISAWLMYGRRHVNAKVKTSDVISL